MRGRPLWLFLGLVAACDQVPTGPGPVFVVQVDPATAELHPGRFLLLSVTLLDSHGVSLTGKAITFSSSDTTVATVNFAGLVTAVRLGTATINAQSEGKNGGAQITVTLAVVASVLVTPTTRSLFVGDSVLLTATPYDSSTTALAGRVVTWASSDTTLARVSATGLVHTFAPGMVTVTATCDSIDGLASIHVKLIAAGHIAPDSATIVPGGELRFRVAWSDSHGTPVPSPFVTWISSDAAVASKPTDGFLTAGVPGSATITATADSVSDAATLRVRTVTFGSVAVSSLHHACGVTSDSAAFCWGNGPLPLGTGTADSSTTPIAVASPLRFVQVSGGDGFSCGRTALGAAYCWGMGASGRLGSGTLADQSTPAAVAGGHTFATISAGRTHACGIDGGGAAWCWGTSPTPSATPVAVPGGVVFRAIAAGADATCGLAVDSTAYCWGLNLDGQVGSGDTAGVINAPAAVAGGLTFRSVRTAGSHSCGVTGAGAAYCWGSNRDGELGTGDTVASRAPVPVSGGLVFTDVFPGGDGATANFACGFTNGGAAYCWGNNAVGQLGNGATNPSPVPIPVTGGLTFTVLTAGAGSACGIATAGITYCWGTNSAGALGTGTGVAFSSSPVRVAGQP